MRKCRKCGCTDNNACIDEHGQACYWVDENLCSACLVHIDEISPNKKGGRELGYLLLNDKINKNNMKKIIIIPTSPFVAVLKKVKEVIDKNPVMDLLDNILIKVRKTDIQVIATDLIVTVIADIEVTNDGDAGYEFLLPFKFLYDTMMLINDSAITIEYIEKIKKESGKNVKYPTAVLTTFSDTYDLDWLDKTDEWPKLPEFPRENSIGIADGFIEWLNLMVTTAAEEKAVVNAAMRKISIKIANNGVAMASTNAYVLVEKNFECDSPNTINMLVSTKIAKALKGFKETSISWSDTHISFISANMTLIGTVQDERYPEYGAYFQDETPNFNVSLNELTGVMQKMSLTKKYADIYFKREIGAIVVESFDADYNRKVTVRIAADYSGQCEKIIVDPEQLLKLLAQVKYVNLSLFISEFNKPIIITTESDKSYRSLLMPQVI